MCVSDESVGGPVVSEDASSQVSGVEASGSGEVCALEGCDVPLPARALDELGRPKGGRRPQFCGKAHADAASRQRRARDVASVADPLSLARAAGEAFLPGARVLAAQLAEVLARFDEAEVGALARVRVAEQEAASAVAEAVSAREAGEAAEVARRQALAVARQDRLARDNAVKEAERVRRESEEIRTAAWGQVAGHERSRGQAEAARVAAQVAADGLIGQNRELREQVEQGRLVAAELTARVAAAGRERERVEGEKGALVARIEAVERLSGLEGERLRARVAAAEGRSADLQAELAAARSTVQARAEEAERLREQLADLRAQSSGAVASGVRGVGTGARRQRKLRAATAARVNRP